MPDPANKPQSSDKARDADEAAKFVFNSFQSAGFSKIDAAKSATLAREMYVFIHQNEKVKVALEVYKIDRQATEIFEGTKKAIAALEYLSTRKMIVNPSKVYSYGAGGGAQVLNVFVDRFASYAESQHLELNQCALGFAKVGLDIATAGTGAVTALSGIGAVIAGVAVISTFKDSLALSKACFVP